MTTMEASIERTSRTKRANRSCLAAARTALVLAAAIAVSSSAAAGPREQARVIHDRLAGVPPEEPVLSAMEASIALGTHQGAIDAAYMAMANPLFYSSVLKNFVTPWTNVDRTVFAPLNDYTATVIGIVRDRRPFTDALTADVVYTGAPGVVPSSYSHTDNDHYIELEEARVDLSDPALLIPQTQSGLPGSQLAAGEAAGVITTRAAGEAFFSAGTNRRMWRFTSINYLCRDLEDVKDITRPADRIRQDVTRSPGGDSSLFLNDCIGCHSGMDPMAQAYAYFEWDEDAERVVHTPGVVQPKYHINDTTFEGGFRTPDNRWTNYWRSGKNANLGWNGPSSSGYGPATLGIEVSSSRAFSECQVEKVFAHVCFREPADPTERAEVSRIADEFEASGYDLTVVFAEAAVYCMGN